MPTAIEGAVKIIRMADKLAEVEKAAKIATAPKVAMNTVTHPLDPTKVYQLPPGMSQKQGQDLIRQYMLIKAKHGEEQITLQSSLSAERQKALEEANAKNEKLQAVIKDLNSRKDLKSVGPGKYYDDNTGRTWQVHEDGTYTEILK